ncbi:hypothetical protein DV736_g5459, partial [Chaetothyriales sp. CBS 134916]
MLNTPAPPDAPPDPPSQARQPPSSRPHRERSSDAHEPSPSSALHPAMQQPFYHRDTSLPRGRPPLVATANYSTVARDGRALSAQRHAAETGSLSRDSAAVDTSLRRQNSSSYGHHRQTSVIHGVQHSRNPSFNSPSASSPLSPESLLLASSSSPSAGRAVGLGPGRRLYGGAAASDLGQQASPASAQALGFDSAMEGGLGERPARQRSATPRAHRAQNQSVSGSQTPPELRTPGEYALHHLFHSFVVRADARISQCLAAIDSSPTLVEQTCGLGADPAFDQLISSLGHISRQNPKPLVDCLMLWRKNKADQAATLRRQMYQLRPQRSNLSQPGSLPRRHTETDKPADLGLDQLDVNANSADVNSLAHQQSLADKAATISVYVLCRVLIAVFEQSSLAAITPELALKLADLVFSKLRDVNPSDVLASNLRLANWRIFAQVLGHMSRADFDNVTNRCLHQIEDWQAKVTKMTTTVSAREYEARIELLLLAMRTLDMTVSDESSPGVCRFLTELGKLFADAHGPRVKQAYCQLLDCLLIPVASHPDCFQKAANWRELINTVNSRLPNMLAKLRHWNSGFPLSILLICISPQDVFASQWMSTINTLVPKLKDKATRAPVIQAISQLVWTYLVRTPDSPPTKQKRMDEIVRLAFPAGKKTHVSIESGVSDALVQLVRIIASVSLDTAFRSVIFPLMNHDTIKSSRDLKIEHMEPERIVIGIRSFLAVIADRENPNQSRAPFPVYKALIHQSDGGLPSSPLTFRPDVFLHPSWRPSIPSSAPSSLPVNVQSLSDNARQYYFQFCEILGKITILCDNTFGGQASLNEKFSTLTPKTPLTDAFSSLGRRDEGAGDQKQLYLELLHVAVQALPRCFTDHIPLNTLINLLCTGSAHVDPAIAASAAKSLKAIAKQGYAQSVAMAFPRFIFNYDMQYSTMSDEGRLGPTHIETTLALYLELLQIWTEQVKQKAKGTAADSRDRAGAGSARAIQMEMTNVITLVDEIEVYGLFFLCSQSRRVRSYAIRVLRLVVHFDEVLGKHEPSRIIKIVETHSQHILALPEELLNLAERSRLQRDRHKRVEQNTLIDISSSDNTYDASLWFKAFPNLVRCVFKHCPHAIALCRPLVCDRILLVQADVEALNKMSAGGASLQDIRTQGRSAATPPVVLVDQWKLYLILVCVTLNSPGAQSQKKLGSARALFSAVIPMLSAGPEAIRNAVVVALGAINPKLYRTLLESLQYAVITCNDEAKARINGHNRTPSSPQRSQMTERLRTEVAHVYKLTASFLRHDDVIADEWILNNIVQYTKDLRLFLSDTDVQSEWRFNRLRCHFCGLLEEVFEATRRTASPLRWMPFEARKSAFGLMEEWCGFSPDSNGRLRQGDSFDPQLYSSPRDPGDRSRINAAVEKEKSSLRVAALSSMAALCAGPVRIKTDQNAVLAFNIPRMLNWIESIFYVPNDKIHAIGRHALRQLLVFNADQAAIMEDAIKSCYRTQDLKALESYFDVVAEVIIQDPNYPVEFWRVIATVIFTLGSESRSVRMKSAKLLRTVDERQEKSSNLQDFDISISDKTRAVYKLAQFEYSKRLAQAHAGLAFMIFSEFSLHYKASSTDQQRNIVASILPWMQTVELQVDPSTGSPTAESHMLLANMFEITIRSTTAMHNEVQALWQALSTGPHAGNVQHILDFIIFMCLERKEQNFVDYVKQIIVYLASTPAGARVLDFFLLQLTPKTMVNDKKSSDLAIPDTTHMPYTANLNELLPSGNKQSGLSLGQVALIFLVDLMVPPVKLSKDDATRLVHAVFILWDHYTPTVQEQAREMLVHLLHELVATKVDEDILKPRKQQIEAVVEAVRRNDESVSWSYGQPGAQVDQVTANRVPPPMASLSKEVVEIFGLAFDNFSNSWAKEALHWASVCPVRHLACRSFQVFRCISATPDPKMLGDMLARLSNTIADEQSDYQTFSLEILTTLKVIIDTLEPSVLLRYHQFFWTTCACLNTIHEREFYETLGMLEKMLDKVNLADANTATAILKAKPAKWEGDFEGVQALVYKGLRSADSFDRSLDILQKLTEVDDCDLVGGPDRLLFAILAQLPIMLNDLDTESVSASRLAHVNKMADIADRSGLDELAAVMRRFTTQQFANSGEMLTQIVQAVKTCYFPNYDAQSLIFTMGLLMNRTPWFRVKVMDVLCALIPHVDMKAAAITSHGPDLISPLLRLLPTEHCAQALQVMDYIMEVSGSPLERHHLRMSMVSGVSRAVRKEYDHTKSLYGIPMSSGWSIPMPAIYSSLTRNNVHAVFHTCGDTEMIKETEMPTPEIEFHQDDGYAESYFPPQSRSGTIRSAETAETNIRDLVNTLDSLDDFFDEVDRESVTTPTGSARASYVAVDLHDGTEILYDEQTAPILQRSLHRTSSTLSFQNGLSEHSQHQRGQQSFSLQTSFSSIDELSGPGPSLASLTPTSTPESGPSSVQNWTKKPVAGPPVLTTAPVRPSLHARSITSPANQFPVSQPTAGSLMSSPAPGLAFPIIDTNMSLSVDDGVLSDSESSSSPFPPLSGTLSQPSKQAPNGTTPTSANDNSNGGAFTIQGMRRGMRRLTGGKSESAKEKEKIKEATRLRALSGGGNLKEAGPTASGMSPRVPRVPLDVKPFWPLLFTFVLPRALSYARAIRVAIRTRPQPRPLSPATRRGLNVLFGSVCIFLLLSIIALLAAARPGYDNVFQTTHSRLHIPTDVLFTRLTLARANKGLTEMDEALRTRLTTPALRALYLRFGPSTLVECPFCMADDHVSFLLYHLPANVLLLHLLHFFVLALATSAVVVGGPDDAGGQWRLRALLGAAALLALDLYVLATYTPHVVDGKAAVVSPSPPAGLFWTTALLRPLALCVYDAFVALVIWGSATGSLLVLSPLFGLASSATTDPDPMATARRLHESLTAANVALQTVQAKLRAVHVARNAVVRNSRLKNADDAYWRDVVALEGEAEAEGGAAAVWEQVQNEEEVQVALARAYGSGTIDVARMRREADAFVRSVTTALDGI